MKMTICGIICWVVAMSLIFVYEATGFGWVLDVCFITLMLGTALAFTGLEEDEYYEESEEEEA